MPKRIGIIDYGMGNLHSISNALAYIGLPAFISGEEKELALADALILPGVGAFPDAMQALFEQRLVEFIQTSVQDKPLLGICLGMQLLFEKGYEGRICGGLSLIEGEVVRLSAYERSRAYKVPHMGWNKLVLKDPSNPLMRGIGDAPYVYYVHSYKGVCKNSEDLAAYSEYGEEVAGVVSRGNAYGTQFHPEKSENVGLQILRNFGGLF